MYGAKPFTEAAEYRKILVGERSAVERSMTGTTCGRGSSENAGMSSESEVRIFTVESLRFPREGSSA